MNRPTAQARGRSVSQARVCSRNKERWERFASRRSERLNPGVAASHSVQDCDSGADVVVVITSTREAVLEGRWLVEGTYVNAAGGNYWIKGGVDEAGSG